MIPLISRLVLQKSCPAASFPCKSCASICVAQEWQCDGENDCPDGSDESHVNCSKLI